MTPKFQQQAHAPLFPRVLYNRPVTRTGAGRLLVVGGHRSEFSLPIGLNQLALAAGAGECRVILPDALTPLLAGAPGAFFGASTQSGSLSREALGHILQLAEDTDALAVGASLSNNSDTTMLTERLITEATGSLIIFDDGATTATAIAQRVATRANTLFVLTMPQVFKLANALELTIHVRPGGGLINKTEIVERLATAIAGDIAVFGTELIVAGHNSGLTVTPINYRLSTQPALIYAIVATFWIQNRHQPAAGLTTGAYVINQIGEQFSQTDSPTLTQLDRALRQTLRATEDTW